MLALNIFLNFYNKERCEWRGYTMVSRRGIINLFNLLMLESYQPGLSDAQRNLTRSSFVLQLQTKGYSRYQGSIPAIAAH